MTSSFNIERMAASETTRMFRRVRQMEAPVGRQTMLFGRIRQSSVTGGAKSAISDCITFKSFCTAYV